MRAETRLVRHGQVHNPEGVIYGRLPGYGLSDVGRQQIGVAAAVLADRRPIDALIASPMQRAQESAAILAETRTGERALTQQDTQVGSHIGPLTKGPLSIMDIVAWCAGALGVPDADVPVCAGGLLDEVATGPQVVAWLAQLVTDWAGDDDQAVRVALVRPTGNQRQALINGWQQPLGVVHAYFGAHQLSAYYDQSSIDCNLELPPFMIFMIFIIFMI